jgi:hypothetical protein
MMLSSGEDQGKASTAAAAACAVAATYEEQEASGSWGVCSQRTPHSCSYVAIIQCLLGQWWMHA